MAKCWQSPFPISQGFDILPISGSLFMPHHILHFITLHHLIWAVAGVAAQFSLPSTYFAFKKVV